MLKLKNKFSRPNVVTNRVRPQVTVQTVFKINFDECRKIHTHFSSHQKICVKQIVSSRRASNERPY